MPFANIRYVDRQFYELINERSISSFAVFDLGARCKLKLADKPLGAR